MRQRHVLVLSLFLLLPAILWAQSGTIQGIVTDAGTNLPIIRTSIRVLNTNHSAITDADGRFTISNVPAGVYEMHANAVGFRPGILSEVLVRESLATTLEFKLIALEPGREDTGRAYNSPMIDQNSYSSISLQRLEIEHTPYRELQNYVVLQSGVIEQGGDLYIRGGRRGELKYTIDGVNVTNPFHNSNGTQFIREAIEELVFQNGGCAADLPGGNSGLVRSVMRTGGSKLHFSIDYSTDDFAKPGSTFLNTTSRGYRNLVVTLSGPVITDQLHFFIAAQHNYLRNKQAIFLEPFNFSFKTVRSYGSQPLGLELPGPVKFEENYIYNNWAETNGLQGSVTYDGIHDLHIQFDGSYSGLTQKDNDWPDALTNIFRGKRVTESSLHSSISDLRAEYTLSPSTRIAASVFLQNCAGKTYDPDFKDDWKKYPDSLENAKLGYTGFRSRYYGPLPYVVITDFYLNHENVPNNRYQMENQLKYGCALDFSTKFSNTFELKAGGSAEMWTMRMFDIQNISNYMRADLGSYYGAVPTHWISPEQRRIELAKFVNGNVNHYGYDIDGNETNETTPPKKPVLLSGYIHSLIESNFLIVNLGARVEYYDLDVSVPENPADINSYYDWMNYIVDVKKMKKKDPFVLFLPRIGISVPINGRSVIFANYGKYAQLPALDQIYQGDVYISQTISLSNRSSTPYGAFIKPETSTQAEIGLKQTLKDNLIVSLTIFQKNYPNLMAVRNYTNEEGYGLFNAYMNADDASAAGFETMIELHRTNRVSARLNYTLSRASGTGSNPLSGIAHVRSPSGKVNDFSTTQYPLDFDRTHSGSLLVNYRFSKSDGGPFFGGFGVNAVFSFASGRKYTQLELPRSMGQSSTFDMGVRYLIDPGSQPPLETLNASEGPWVYNVDVQVSKIFYIGDVTAEFYIDVINVFDTKSVENVFPATGTPKDDGWLSSSLAYPYRTIPNYVSFYKTINLSNRYSLLHGGVDDVYGVPREIRIGVRVQI